MQAGADTTRSWLLLADALELASKTSGYSARNELRSLLASRRLPYRYWPSVGIAPEIGAPEFWQDEIILRQQLVTRAVFSSMADRVTRRSRTVKVRLPEVNWRQSWALRDGRTLRRIEVDKDVLMQLLYPTAAAIADSLPDVAAAIANLGEAQFGYDLLIDWDPEHCFGDSGAMVAAPAKTPPKQPKKWIHEEVQRRKEAGSIPNLERYGAPAAFAEQLAEAMAAAVRAGECSRVIAARTIKNYLLPLRLWRSKRRQKNARDARRSA